MAEQIKEMQRSDPVAKEQWYAYCEAFGDNVRDPAKHDVAFINSFITQYQSGARLEYKEGQDLVKFIKLGQRKSQTWKSSWEMYCNSKPINGKPAHDPAKHDSSFLEGFFDFVGMMALSRGAAGGMGMGGMGPPLKRGPGASTGDPQKDQFVAKIKAFQRQGEMQKQTWHAFADSSLGGMYDPARADTESLRMFIMSNGIQDIEVSAPGGGFGGMGMGGGAGGGVGPNHPLVAQVKAYQKSGEAQKEAWHNYADSNLGGKRDPAKADMASLQTFIATYGVA